MAIRRLAARRDTECVAQRRDGLADTRKLRSVEVPEDRAKQLVAQGVDLS